MTQQFSWHEMLRLFRMLGGTADNIDLGTGAFGRGLMASDPGEPILVHIPPNLLFPVENVEFDGDRLQLRKTADIGEAERTFFDVYENQFSWGAGGQEESTAFIAALDRLPEDVRRLLCDDFGFVDLLQGDPHTRAQQRFIKSRMVRYGESHCIMPLIELANHDPGGLPYTREGGISIKGQVTDEILVTYGTHDSFTLFQTFGFVGLQPGAFSQPTKVQLENRELIILEDPGAPVKRGNTWVPQLRFRDDGAPILPFLMIGHRGMPRQPRGIFRTLARDASIRNPDEVFDSIVHFNWAKFLRLLEMLEPYQGEMVVSLRKVLRYQLEAIAHCIGSLELEREARPEQQEWSMKIE